MFFVLMLAALAAGVALLVSGSTALGLALTIAGGIYFATLFVMFALVGLAATLAETRKRARR